MMYQVVYPYEGQLDTFVEFGHYIDGALAMRLSSPIGELLSIPTVCLTEYGITPPADHVYIKGWSEGEGMAMALAEAGILELVPAGVVMVGPYDSPAHLAKILIPIEVQ